MFFFLCFFLFIFVDGTGWNPGKHAYILKEYLKTEKSWSYSTVKTLMDRMVDKALLTTEKVRNLILYRSSITEQQAQKREVMRTLKRAFEGALTPMMQFLLEEDNLTEEQLREMENLIKQKRSAGGGK